MRHGLRGPTNGGPAGCGERHQVGAGHLGPPPAASPEDVARRMGKAAAPAVDPTQWAEVRRQKVERAERLRAENRRRLQAMGQLPGNGNAAEDVAGPLSGMAQQAPQLGSWPPAPGPSAAPAAVAPAAAGYAPGGSPPHRQVVQRAPAWPEADAAPAAGVPSGGYARQSPPWAEVQDNVAGVGGPPAAGIPRAGRQPPPWAEMEADAGRQQPPWAEVEDERTLGPAPQDERTLGPPPQRPPPQKPVSSLPREGELSAAAKKKGHTQEDLAELLQQAVAVGAYEEGAAELRSYIDGADPVLASPTFELKGAFEEATIIQPADEVTIVRTVEEATIIPASQPPAPAEMTMQPAPAPKPAGLPMGRGTPLPASVLDAFNSPPNLGSPGPNLKILRPVGGAAEPGTGGANSHETTAASRIELTAVLDRAYQNHAGDTQMVAMSPLVSPVNPPRRDDRTLDLRQVENQYEPPSEEHTLIPNALPRPEHSPASQNNPHLQHAPASQHACRDSSNPAARAQAEVVAQGGPPAPAPSHICSPPRPERKLECKAGASEAVNVEDFPTLLPPQKKPPPVAADRNAGFHVESYVLPGSVRPGAPSEGDANSWWAKGPGPSWMQQHDGSAGSLKGLAEQCTEPANATMWPARDARREVKRTDARQAEQPALETVPSIEAVPEAGAEGVDPWAVNLRGSTADDYNADDPLVFGKPRPRQNSQKRSKPRSVPAPEVRNNRADAGNEAQSEEADAWICGLRGADDDESVEDPLVFGKPRSQPRKRTQRPPMPRPHSLTSEPDPSLAGASGSGKGIAGGSSGSRPATGPSGASSSGYFSKRQPSINQQMPEGLRKRLEQRAGDQNHSERGGGRSRDRRANSSSKDHQAGGEPAEDCVAVKPVRSDSRGALVDRARNAVIDEDCGSSARGNDQVRLPPIGPESRGRRCASQPPVDPSGPSSRQKKQARPQSLGAGNARAAEKEEEGGRQMFDKNTLRTRERDLFAECIHQYRLEKCPDRRSGRGMPVEDPVRAGPVQVFVRKRPLFEKEEKKNGDYDVATILPGHPVPRHVVLHNCLFQADLKTPFIQHLTFEFDHVWDESAENEDVYRHAAAPLVMSSLDGGISTMFMFGQTGSGKTFTMSAIQKYAADDLYEGADGEEPWLSVTFVELRGNRCFDLLAPSISEGRKKGDTRPELRLREQGDGGYAADGAVDLYPKTSDELCAVMEMAQSRRATSATDANAVSSRSHAVCMLRLCQSEGQLTLVDCAGTERRKDSMFHSKERQQEGAEINASLHALKECIRYLITTQRVPSHAYRASSLTKILADAFMRGSASKLAVICTASPCATDTEHTLATLRMGMALGGRGAEREEKQVLLDFLQARKAPRLPHPKQWTPDQVCEWLTTLEGGRFQDVLDALPSNFTGQMLVRLTESRCVQLCGSERRGRQLFDLLHQEIHRVEQSRKAGH
mmetsp:Transcript_2816/g.4889  ORF Transcript_2816/g.4889 Transcript_2816/m.4889 type:complete len:1449 (+) Transcript_2816:161-4507(+)